MNAMSLEAQIPSPVATSWAAHHGVHFTVATWTAVSEKIGHHPLHSPSKMPGRTRRILWLRFSRTIHLCDHNGIARFGRHVRGWININDRRKRTSLGGARRVDTPGNAGSGR